MTTDPDQKLNAVLEDLRELLESADDLDASEREALGAAAVEIQDALDAEEDTVSQLSAMVRERVERFGGEHPRLAEVIRRLVDQLSEMGI